MNLGNRFWIGFSISILLLAFFLLTLDVGQLTNALLNAEYLYVAPAVCFYMVSIIFRTLRWQRLLLHMRYVKVVRLFPVVVVGYMANNLLPVRLGELVRSYYLGEREGISKTAALMTIFIERLLDALTLLLFIASVAVFVPLTGLAEAFAERFGVKWPILVMGLSLPFVIAFAFLILVALFQAGARSMVMALSSILPGQLGARLVLMFNLLLEGLHSLKSPRSVLSLFILSVPIWIFETALFFVIGFSFGLHHMYGTVWEMAIAIVLVASITNIGSSIPAAPGGVGLFEILARETLVLLPLAAVDRSVAGAYVAVVHAALLLPMIVLGQMFLWFQNVSLGTLSRSGRSSTSFDIDVIENSHSNECR